MADNILSDDKTKDSYIIEISFSSVNKANDTFLFYACLKEGFKLEPTDAVVFKRCIYHVTEIKGKKKNLTLFYAKKLKNG